MKAAACVCSGCRPCLCRAVSGAEFTSARMAARLPLDALGRRVLCGTDYATVRYVGSVPPTAGKHHSGK